TRPATTPEQGHGKQQQGVDSTGSGTACRRIWTGCSRHQPSFHQRRPGVHQPGQPGRGSYRAPVQGLRGELPVIVADSLPLPIRAGSRKSVPLKSRRGSPRGGAVIAAPVFWIGLWMRALLSLLLG